MATYLARIARPYAQAAFQYANEKSDFAEWKVFLDNAASIVTDPKMSRLMRTDALNREQVRDLFNEILKPSLNEARANFLRLVIQNKRVIFFPDIAAHFETLLSAFMKKSNVRLVTAVDAQEAFKVKLAAHLSHKLNKEIVLQCEKDPSILGGAVIYVDNKVIDGSLRGKLNRLLEFTLR